MREAYLLPRRANGRRSSAKGRKLPQDWTAHPPPPVPLGMLVGAEVGPEVGTLVGAVVGKVPGAASSAMAVRVCTVPFLMPSRS